jgi:hypothetical protein
VAQTLDLLGPPLQLRAQTSYQVAVLSLDLVLDRGARDGVRVCERGKVCEIILGIFFGGVRIAHERRVVGSFWAWDGWDVGLVRTGHCNLSRLRSRSARR